MDQQLNVFITVVEKGNFSRAAEELHMTQPAVSQHIQSLERTMGTRLLERNNKYVQLNKAGEIVYHHAKEILGLYTTMHYLIDDLTNKTSGSLSIGASYTFGEYLLPHIITKIHAEFPLIIPTITIENTEKVAKLVLGNQLDIGIVEGEFKDKNLVIEPFSVDKMYLVASPNHRLAQKNSEVTISELEEETWIVRESGSGTREATEKVFGLHGMNPKKTLEFGSTQLIKESLEANLGISLLSYWSVRKECSMGSLSFINKKQISITRNFSIVLRSSFQTKALKVFLELLKENRPMPKLLNKNI